MELQQTNVLTSYLLDTDLSDFDAYYIAIKNGEILLNNEPIDNAHLMAKLYNQMAKHYSKKLRAFAKKVIETVIASEKEELGEIFYLTYSIEYYDNNRETLTYDKGDEAIVKKMIDMKLISIGGDGFIYYEANAEKYLEV